MRRILPLLFLFLLLPLTALADAEALLIGTPGSAPPITLYQGPSAYAEPVGGCYPGVKAEVLDQGSGFVNIRIGWLTGWVMRENLLPSGEWTEADIMPLPSGEVTPPGTERYQHLYAEPDGTPLASLARYLPVSVLGVTADDNWLLVQLHDGTVGCLPADAVIRADGPSRAYVTASDPSLRLHLRTEPTTKCDSLGNYYCGAEASLLFTASADDGWTRVSVCGRIGWMKTEYLTFSPTVGEWLPPLGIVQGTDASGLNLRLLPDYDAPVIARYVPGTAVEIMAVYGIWAHVRTQDGHAGYMLLKHLGGDQPAAVANAAPLDGTTVRLLGSRPVSAWQHTADGYVFAFPESCIVADLTTGAVTTVPAESLPFWHAALPGTATTP